MSNSVEAKIMVPVEPGPADEITHGNSDTEGLPTVKAESIQSDEMTPNDGQDAIITTRSDAVAEVKKMTQKGSIDEATDMTPKKRGAVDGDESEQPSKKRSPAKTKNVVATTGIANDGDLDAMEGIVPVTPKKRTPSKSKGKKPNKDDEVTEGVAATASTGVATRQATNLRGEIRRRTAPVNAVAPGRDIPSSWDDADEADRLLVTMKENGEPWKKIREAIMNITKQGVGPSTLPNRYNRIKVQMMRLKEGDSERLLAAKAEVEAEFQTGKFTLMATKIENAGGAKYPPLFLQKKLKELETKGKSKLVSTHDDANDANDANDADDADDADDTDNANDDKDDDEDDEADD